jgi:hypothetical protein
VAGRASSDRPQAAAIVAALPRKVHNFGMTSHRQSGH